MVGRILKTFSADLMKFQFMIKWWIIKSSSTSARTLRNTRIAVFADFCPNVFLSTLFFPFSTSTWNFQGSISIPDICHFFTQTKFLEKKIYTEKMRKLRQNTQKIANFLRYYGKIHSKLPIFRVKSVKIYTGPKKFTRTCSWGSWQISGMVIM